MDRSNTLKLVAETYTENAIGVYEPKETETEVFCSIESITQREWAEASRQGFNPETKATINRYEYNNEQIVVIEGKRYSVYRTFVAKGEKIELYLERKVGTETADENNGG